MMGSESIVWSRKVFKGTLLGTSEDLRQRMPYSTHRYSARSRRTEECREVLKGAGSYPMVLCLRVLVHDGVGECRMELEDIQRYSSGDQ